MHVPFIFGLNYETASFEIREKLAFSKEDIPNALNRLQNSGITKEAFILSTCNRTEIYCLTQDIDSVINVICDLQNVCPRTVKKHSYIYQESECIKHLFRVVSGLESMILGETEIVAQTKDAIAIAKESNSIGQHLTGVFHMAMSVEKDVRNATEINHIAISMGKAVSNLVAVNVDNVKEQGIMFIGAGSMMQQIAPHFSNINCKEKTIINRTIDNANKLALKVNASTNNLAELKCIVSNYSIIIACCSSDRVLLNEEVLHDSLKSNRPILIIDLSMPLITDLNLRKYESITLLTIDDIAKIVDVGVQNRKIAALSAQSIIEDKLIDYQNWLKKRQITPVIKALRDNAESTRLEVLLTAQKQLQHGEPIDEVLNNLSIKLTNKLLHNPTANLSTSSGQLQDDLTNLTKFLYNLDC